MSNFRGRRLSAPAGLILLIVLGGCSSSPTTGRPTGPVPTRSTTSAGDSSAADLATTTLAAMSEAQRVGQLIMVGAGSGQPDPAARSAIQESQVGSVILMGTSTLPVAGVADLTAQLQAAAGATKLFVGTDQEGGTVQRLRGPGFTDLPSALAQGQLTPSALQVQARSWASELARAGINLDLAPVADTVASPAAARANPPIGQLDREFGYDPDTVASHVTSFVRGMSAAGVDTTVKHFPGLGRVTGNTDTTAGVTDDVTTSTDEYLEPFTAAVDAHVPFVMMSTAIYTRLDPTVPAAFSPTIVTGLLRGALGFQGVVISDDVGAARQVGSYPVGERAVDVVAAGGDVVLTVVASQAPAMAAALLARARSDPGFAAQIDAAALRVLRAKQALGLLH